ncbi:MAG: EAL domain-containing protein [Hyphomicrobiaceae bacterium]
MIALLWAGVIVLLDVERQSNRFTVEKDTAILARMFEQNIIRNLGEIDHMLRNARQSYQQDHTGGWSNIVRRYLADRVTVLQVDVVGVDGKVRASVARSQLRETIDPRNAEYLEEHAAATVDGLLLGKPRLQPGSTRWIMQLARRLIGPDGGSDGLIVASIEPSVLIDVEPPVEYGEGSAVAVVGDGGTLITGLGEIPDIAGARLQNGLLPAAVTPDGEGALQHRVGQGEDARVAAFRTVRGHPLQVLVSTPERQPPLVGLDHRTVYLLVASLITLAIVIAMLCSMDHNHRLAGIRRAFATKSKQLEVTLENIAQGVLMVDRHGQIRFLSRRCAELLGVPWAEAEHISTYRHLVGRLERRGEYALLSDAGLLDVIRDDGTGAGSANYERMRPDGTVLEVRSQPLPDGGFVRTISDISRRRSAEARIRKLAREDGLTELSNRAEFHHRLEQATAGLRKNCCFAVHIVDLDRFKQFNDTYGHLAGDKLLRSVAERLRATVRSDDVVARIGGDEFAIIQRDVTEPIQAMAMAERVCMTLAAPFLIEDLQSSVGCSIGVALAPRDAATASDILYAADLALYATKAGHRGSFSLYAEEMSQQRGARLALEMDLANALLLDQFELHYQPVKSIATGEISAYEALIRWRHPRRGFVEPGKFIPLAEENGFIVELGEWVLRTACRQMSRRCGSARVAVNISPVQFRDPDLVRKISAAILDSGLPPSRLEVEITETALMRDDALTQQHLHAMRELGIHISIDDFGTGYSSLAYLLSYPVQTIKVDRSFVAGLGRRENCAAVVKTILMLAASLGLSTTAEGVETAEQLDILRDLGCTDAQGYYFSMPLPADEVLPPEAESPAPELHLAAG